MITPTHDAARARLAAFLPYAGFDYASQRNFDRAGHPNVSRLSPYLRHRILTEEEVLTAILSNHSAEAAGKFIQEVYWRTYWKGWLEMRPSVWTQYKGELQAALNRIQTEAGLRADWESACKGDTGIDCFDHWAQELVETGYLHNHARMWFASIWIYTLRLPWVLGADFFMRHLLDGDPASNTLSWRWVGGLQTRGKTYLATAENIEKFTNGRFAPKGLATHAPPLDGPPNPDPLGIPPGDTIDRQAKTGFLITEEDLSPDWLLGQATPIATACLDSTADRSPLTVAPQVAEFVDRAMEDTAGHMPPPFGDISKPQNLAAWAHEHGITQIIMSYNPTGPAADALHRLRPELSRKGITLCQRIRPYDASAWPFATKGFFKFKEKIPQLLTGLRQRIDAP